MRWFRLIDDELLGPLPAQFETVLTVIRELRRLLDVDSYDDMGQAGEHQQRLHELEQQLAELVARPLQTADQVDLSTIPRELAEAWYAAVVAAVDLDQTVGDTSRDPLALRSSIALRSMPRYRTERPSPSEHHKRCEQIAQVLGLSTTQQQTLNAAHDQRLKRLQRAQQLVDALRHRLSATSDGVIDQQLVHALFKQLFPDSPLRIGDVDVVVTRTATYWALASSDELLKPAAPTAADNDQSAAAAEWIRSVRRFRFEVFTHFPMFGVFDARDTATQLIDELAVELQWTPAQVRAQLDRCVMLEDRSQLEKYLIHDSWGHVWQAYLCDLQPLYDRLATLQFPIAADHHVEDSDGDVLCLADCWYLHHDGRISFDQSVAERLIQALLEERVEGLLTSICAELTADIVEYGFGADVAEDHAADADTETVTSSPDSFSSLPSSSLFSHRPAKLDFAWADMQYFARAVRRPLRQYQRNPALRDGLVTRLAQLLRMKYPRHQAQISEQRLLETVQQDCDRWVDLFAKIQDQALAVDFTSQHFDQHTSVNMFTRVFTNLVRIQMAVNDAEAHWPKGQERRWTRTVVQMFIIHYFQQEPGKHFWDLDEQLAQWLLPLVGTLTNDLRSDPTIG